MKEKLEARRRRINFRSLDKTKWPPDSTCHDPPPQPPNTTTRRGGDIYRRMISIGAGMARLEAPGGSDASATY